MALRRDFRKLDPTTQAELRRVAVAMVEAGKTRVEAAATVGVNRHFVGEWVETVRRSGERLIADRCPDQLTLPFALWTREAVGALIERETGMRPSASALGRTLRAWGFTAQRPARRATDDGAPSDASRRSAPGCR